jgi:hypothetical protein
VIRNLALTAIGAAFVAIAVYLMASGHAPLMSPDIWAPLTFFLGCAMVGAVETVQGLWPVQPVFNETQLALKHNRVRYAVLGLAGALWFATGVIGLSGTVFPAVLSWLVIGFGGLAAVALLSRALDGRDIVVIDRDGIIDRRVLDDRVTWADVRDAYTAPDAVTVELLRAESYETKRTLFGRLFRRSVQPLHISTIQMTGTRSDIMDAIRRFGPADLGAHRWAAYEGDDDEAEDF